MAIQKASASGLGTDQLKGVIQIKASGVVALILLTDIDANYFPKLGVS
jgi:hypothetical protein